MTDLRRHGRRGAFCGAALATVVLAWCGVAAGHGLSIFAWAEGPIVRGEVYFHGGAPARGVAVDVLDAAGRPAGRATTDAEGRFRFTPPRRGQYRFVVATADGHRAEFVLAAEEMPSSRPDRAPGAVPAAGSGGSAGSAPAGGVVSRGIRAGPASAGGGALAPELERAVRQAVRRELAAWERRTRVRDVVGGIGWVLGLAGLAALLVRRRGRGGRGAGSPRE